MEVPGRCWWPRRGRAQSGPLLQRGDLGRALAPARRQREQHGDVQRSTAAGPSPLSNPSPETPYAAECQGGRE
jgi:hypothetical protein